MSKSLEFATDYLRRGWQPLPVPHRSKNPDLRAWQNLILSEKDLPKHFNGKPQNIGVLLGAKSNGLTDVDLDSPEAIRIADFFLPKTNAEFGRKSKPRSHRLYYCQEAKFEKFNNPFLIISDNEKERKAACIVELRAGDGKQTVFPGSTHQSGESINWQSDGEPLKIDAQTLRRSVALLASACLISKFWRDGIRNDLNLALSGALLRNGFNISETKNFIRAIGAAANDEEITDRIRAIDATAQKLENGENVFGFPKLAELTDKKLVETVCKWLQIEKQSQENYQTENFENPKSEIKPLRAVRLSEVKSEPINWLWQPLLAIGTFNLLEGEEGIGKTFLTCALSCAVASGKGLPNITENHQQIEPSNVLIISAEDSVSYTLKPRLEMMSAPCERIIAIDEPFTLNHDGILRLSMCLAEYEPKLVIIDPLFSFTGKINLNNDNEIRSITDELKRLAEKYQCVILGIRHIGKSKGFGDARTAGLNGIGWRASARSVLLIGKNPENELQKALCQTKSNLGEKYKKSIGFEIKNGEFFWTGESTLTQETMLSSLRIDSKDEQSEKDFAIEFLRDLLSDGEKLSKEIYAEAKQNGISNRTLNRAKSELNIKSRREGYKPAKWFWQLSEDCRINGGGNLRANQVNKVSYSNDLTEGCQDNISGNLHAENGNLRESKETNMPMECSTCGCELGTWKGGFYCPMGCKQKA